MAVIRSSTSNALAVGFCRDTVSLLKKYYLIEPQTL